MEGCGSGGTPANSRWNPTKEQIGMLESLYRQGVRTPNAEQIQQITSRLNEYGHIEGKNVFYWFQNHKARQRQKQKQETLAYFSSFLHRHPQPPPVFPSHYAPQTVVCNSYHLQKCDMGFPSQYDSKNLPGSGKRRSRTLSFEKRRNDGQTIAYEEPIRHGCTYRSFENGDSNIINDLSRERETLALFPLHPSDDLQSRSVAETTTDDCSGPSSSSGFQEGCGGQPFIDFFSGKCSSS